MSSNNYPIFFLMVMINEHFITVTMQRKTEFLFRIILFSIKHVIGNGCTPILIDIKRVEVEYILELIKACITTI